MEIVSSSSFLCGTGICLYLLEYRTLVFAVAFTSRLIE